MCAVCHSVCVWKSEDNLVRVGYPLPMYGFQGLISSPQALQQVLLSTEPSCWFEWEGSPIGSYIWLFGSQLVDMIRKD